VISEIDVCNKEPSDGVQNLEVWSGCIPYIVVGSRKHGQDDRCSLQATRPDRSLALPARFR
jgi:hypothetical protein